MLDKPLTFTAINLITYVVVLAVFGFSASLYLAILFSVGIVWYNYKFLGFIDSLTLAVIYLLCFDSELFYFTIANIRIWYFYLVIIYFSKILKGFKDRQALKLDKGSLVQNIGALILMVWSVFYLLTDELIASSYNVKYWIFYIGLFLTLNYFFKRYIRYFDEISDYFISLTIFICLFGLVQFSSNLLFIPNFQFDYFNIRPSGFFSETTWYSEFIFFGLLFIILKILKNARHRNYIYFIPFFLLGFTVSVTRNTYVALAIFIVISFFCGFVIERKFYTRIIGSIHLKLFVIILIIATFSKLSRLDEIVTFFALKFSGNDGSAQGRIEAYKLSWEMLTNSPIMGNGFYWDFSQSTETGSALGAKSFNLFLMISHIFGFIGFAIFFIFILGGYIYRLLVAYIINKSIYIRYALITILCFLQMAMFAPIHQYPFGMLIISLSCLLYFKGISSKT